MSHPILELSDELQSKGINKVQFFDKFYSETGMILHEDFCLTQINKGLINKDSETADIFIQIGFMLENSDALTI